MVNKEKTLVDTMVVKQDVGHSEPQYKKVILQFWSDGSVTWIKNEEPDKKDLYSFNVGDKSFL